MPEDPNKPAGQPDPNQTDGAGCDSDLDRLLSEAAALMDEMQTQVGRVDREAREASGAAAERSVIQTLAEVDQLLCETNEELGTLEGPAPKRQDPFLQSLASKQGPAEAAADRSIPQADEADAVDDERSREPARSAEELPDPQVEIPDFMAEFTRPEEDSPARRDASTDGVKPADPPLGAESPFPEPDEPAAVAKASPGRISSFPRTLPSDEHLPSVADLEPDPVSPASPSPAEPEPVQAAPRAAIEFWNRALLPVCTHGARVLELIHRPVEGLSAPAQQAFGLVAVATFATGLLLILVSLF